MGNTKIFHIMMNRRLAALSQLHNIEKERDSLRSANRVLMQALGDRDKEISKLRKQVDTNKIIKAANEFKHRLEVKRNEYPKEFSGVLYDDFWKLV